MSADIQAKYNALLLKFVGDRTIPVDPETEMDIHKDIAQYMHEKNKRIQARAQAGYDALVANIGEPPEQEAQKRGNDSMLAQFNEICKANPPGFRSAESMQEDKANEIHWMELSK